MEPTRTGGLGDARDSILLVANYESDVGYAWWLMERFWAAIAAAATNEGRRCVLAYPSIRRIPDVVLQAPLKVVEFDVAPRSWMAAWRGVRFIHRHRIESVYLTDWPYFHPAYLLWRLAGVRQIVIHDHSPGDRPAITGMRRILKEWLHRTRLLAATYYVAVSPYIAERLRRNIQVPAARCVVVTNGIRPLECAAADRGSIRQRLGVPAGAILIVLVSRATHYKNLEFAIRCLSALLKNEPAGAEIYALHCGDGPDLQSFRAMAGDHGIAGRMRFLGRRDDVREILCAADIAFHPSRGEAMSLAPHPARAMELTPARHRLWSLFTRRFPWGWRPGIVPVAFDSPTRAPT